MFYNHTIFYIKEAASRVQQYPCKNDRGTILKWRCSGLIDQYLDKLIG